MTETDFRHLVVRLLGQYVHAFPVENTVGVGMPDVCTTLGWIELKVGREPVRATTRVDLGMRPAQRVWHRQWIERGGRSWTLALITVRDVVGRADDSSVWAMHDGAWAADNIDQATLAELRASAVGWWPGRATGRELVDAMIKPRIQCQ